ncbi:MAG: glutathione S-transferase family protein [Leptolyngbyaceae cyanobacterium SL_1_1]|nr:glutathione S-transferase family protein [Leptolyngbyaceae cyanobacterium RM1_1_2]NJO12021.1 glutathione S-transferase family protein [Leptolyngbyaceae cyanobacterium SL_1_1]
MALQLVIGNKNYSSWSLRAWLFLQQSQLAFEEIRISLFTQHWHQEIERYSPARQVPVLVDNGFAVWDSIAIFEYVLEKYPQAVGWPADFQARAIARSLSAEMHAGFMAVRAELPQNIRAHRPRRMESFSAAAQQQIQRIQSVWRTCYRQYGDRGPWLFGQFSIADVMYAPVAMRFLTYGVEVDAEARFFVEAVQALPAIKQWVAESAAEPETINFVDEL